MDSEIAMDSSRCRSGCGMVSPVASAARCLAAGITVLDSLLAGGQGHQRGWSAYFSWRSRRSCTTSGRCKESGVYEMGQPGIRAGMGQKERRREGVYCTLMAIL